MGNALIELGRRCGKPPTPSDTDEVLANYFHIAACNVTLRKYFTGEFIRDTYNRLKELGGGFV